MLAVFLFGVEVRTQSKNREAESAAGTLELFHSEAYGAKGMGRYDHIFLDFAHASLTQKKFVEYEFHVNGRGEVACPACGAGMARAEKQEHLASHYVCPRSGLAFYGDAEGISLCLHPAEDVAGKLCSGLD